MILRKKVPRGFKKKRDGTCYTKGHDDDSGTDGQKAKNCMQGCLGKCVYQPAPVLARTRHGLLAAGDTRAANYKRKACKSGVLHEIARSQAFGSAGALPFQKSLLCLSLIEEA